MLDTDAGPLNIPNSSLLASAVGPAPDEPDEKPDDAAGAAPAQDDAAATAVVVAGAEAGEADGRKHPGV